MPRGWADTYVTVAADGTITYDFDGIIHADGLNLDAGTVASPPDTNRIRWIRTSDGAAIASLYSYDDGSAAYQVIEAKSGVLGNTARIILGSGDAGGPGNASVEIDAGSVVKNLLLGNGTSDWLQTPDTGNFQIYAARLTCAAAPAIQYALGITAITRLGSGLFRITHDACQAGAGYMFAGVATCQGNTGYPKIAQFAPIDSTHSDITVVNAAGATVDGDLVYFVGIG